MKDHVTLKTAITGINDILNTLKQKRVILNYSNSLLSLTH